MAASDYSVADLERLLAAKRSQLQGLLKKKTALTKQLAKIDRKIESMGGDAGGPTKGPRAGEKVRRRPKNTASLMTFVSDTLRKKKKSGQTLGELTEAILASGYKSNSNKFGLVVYQALYKLLKNGGAVKDESTGRYHLADAASEA